ncbi:MAG: carbohydrate ABC transporter permease, partial [Alphaproteobacteria bacterium]|nr:carbohydrate ABC transporter permease [Alphaproteobacteria bacterium]
MSALAANFHWRKAVGHAGLALSLIVLLAPVGFVFFWVISLSLKYD